MFAAGGRAQIRIGGALLAALATALVLAPPASAADSRITAVTVDGTQPLDQGYERVFGTVSGVVAGDEHVRGLPDAGLTYTSQYEVIRPTGKQPPVVLVEGENRGSPLLLNALSGSSSANGPPATVVYPSAVSRILASEGVAYARVQWQTGISAGVPASAQGVGEVIERDFGRWLAKQYPRRVLMGVSQGAFFVDTFVAEGFNALSGGDRAYAQALAVDGNGNWMAINRLAGSGAQTPYVLPEGRPLSYPQMLRRPRTDPKLVDVANYTDFYRLRAGLSSANPIPRGVHRYDWPSPHQSFAPSFVFGALGCNGGEEIPLNPLRNQPYLRGLLRGVAGKRLPPSSTFKLGPSPATSPTFNGLPGAPVPVPKTDRSGQPLGGVRFPELSLPLGALQPAAVPPVSTASIATICGNSGGYAPFPGAKVASLYSRADYLRAYGRDIARLRRQGYLRATDLRAMRESAAADYDAAAAG